MDTVYILGVFFFPIVLPFNIDFEYTVVKTGPKDSFFGFSVTQHQEGFNSWLLVGAPQANNSYLLKTGFKGAASGTVFKCSATELNTSCIIEVPFDTDPVTNSESKSNAWLGVSLKSAGKDESVLSCAHRYQYYGPSDAFRLMEGKCYQLGSSLNYKEKSYSPCQSYNNDNSNVPDHDHYGFCEAGIGADIYPELVNGDTDVLVGTVGAKLSAGCVFKMNTDDVKKEGPMPKDRNYYYSYFGYSVTFGNFFSVDKSLIATGGPRHQSKGMVLLYQSEVSSIIQKIPEFQDEIQLASGFGIAICAMDADSNGISELIIGAPFHAPEQGKDRPECGMVYIYAKSATEEKLVLVKKLHGFSSYSNFGYAVANGGNLITRHYDNLIVGAPHEGGGLGAIYVYQGSKTGLLEPPSQKIHASSIHSGLSDNIGLKGFGRSLATGLDLDNNGYTDVLVGAYASDQAVLLRSRPIVHAFYSTSITPSVVDLEKKNCPDGKSLCFKMSFCHNITDVAGVPMKSGKLISIKYTMTVDPISRPRLKFHMTNTNKYSFVVKSTGGKKCQDISLYLVLKDGLVVEYPDISFKVKNEMPYGEKDVPKPERSATIIPSLDQYPVLKELSYLENDDKDRLLHFAMKLRFKRECTHCIPDLLLDSKHRNYTLELGIKSFQFNVTVENKGKDPAYTLGLKFNLPETLQVEQVIDEKNKVFICPKGVCENIMTKLQKGQKAQFGIVLNTRRIDPLAANNISVTVTSSNDENTTTQIDNSINIHLEIKVIADIQLLTATSTQQVLYKEKVKGESAMTSLEDIGQLIEHKFAVRNNGPHLLPITKLTIIWPYETLSGKHLLYLSSTTKSSSNAKCVSSDINIVNIKLSDDGSQDQSKTRSRRDTSSEAATTQTSKPIVAKSIKSKKHTGRILDCYQNTAKCTNISCTIDNIKSGQTVSVLIRSRLWEPTLVLDYYGDVINVVSHAQCEVGTKVKYINDPDPNNNADELYTIITPVNPPKPKEKIALWIIILSVIAGAILLALIIFALYKVGFFRRKRTDEYYGDNADKSLLKSK